MRVQLGFESCFAFLALAPVAFVPFVMMVSAQGIARMISEAAITGVREDHVFIFVVAYPIVAARSLGQLLGPPAQAASRSACSSLSASRGRSSSFRPCSDFLSHDAFPQSNRSTHENDRIASPARGFIGRCDHPGDSLCVFRIERQPIWAINHNHVAHPFRLRTPLVNKSPLRFSCLYHPCDQLFIILLW